MEQSLLQQVREALAICRGEGNLSRRKIEGILATVETHLVAGDRASAQARGEAQAATIDRALKTLSYSEEKALSALMAHVPAEGGVVVASQVADRNEVTRSVIVNGLRKLESAGLIASKSLGTKGTHVKFLIPGARDRLLQLASVV